MKGLAFLPMLNLFVTGKCNLHCDYCFVSGDFEMAQGRLDRRSFEKLKRWLVETGAPALAILGGEPTLHPDLLYFLVSLKNAGIGPVLFTNALFPPDWAEALASLCLNIVVNYNPPGMYRKEAFSLRESNVGSLVDFGGSVSFSKNFAPGRLDFEYLLKGANRFGVKTVRYDLSRPRAGRTNSHYGREGLKEGAKTVADFARAAAEQKISTGLDCCLSPCLFSQQDLSDLRLLSFPFEGTCRPSLDILPDLSVLHCWPLKDLSAESVLGFESETSLLGYFAERALPLRKRARNLCPSCPRPPSECQGGCLAGCLAEADASSLEGASSLERARERGAPDFEAPGGTRASSKEPATALERPGAPSARPYAAS
ncbi:MAG: radical SAM protein [Deltaproteobacteria bacterium]|jgi:MoaA/NifB/PqqE/SkfB family radical SAM enzyme|nr:radical SAM protein [Deltaproteobacteria bacterium]